MRTGTPYLLAGALAAILMTTTSALAGSGVGSVFNLGQVNTVDAQTSLTGNPGGMPELKVTSTGTAAAVRGVAVNGIGTNGISTSGVGQQGLSDSGIGTLGTHGNTTGSSPGVQGETNSTDPAGAGVVGKNTGGGPGLKAIVNAGAPPLSVNSSGKVTNLNADLLDGLDSTGLAYWKLGGNAGTTPGPNFLGTTDNKPFELRVNGSRVLRLEPDATSPNVIGGFSGNAATAGAHGATIAGGGASGATNSVLDSFGTIGGGQNNSAGFLLNGLSENATVAGGFFNTASGAGSTVGGGSNNNASGFRDTIAGGDSNTASALRSAVVGGGGNTASGDNSVVAGGLYNTASGILSFAAGTQAKASQYGSFVWGDGTFSDLTSPATNTFTVRASNGIWLGTTSSPAITSGHFIDTSTGAYLTSTGTWTNSSDRAKKHDLRALNSRNVLDKVARMPITSWSYKAERPSVRHIGPMAQDFYSAFGLGLDNKHITTIDEGGVALAAIQGLYRQNKTLQRENRSLRAELRAQNARLTKLEHAFSALSR
jgi:hypothetical protein